MIPPRFGCFPVVRISGRLYEAVSAFIRRRSPQALYHSALIVGTADGSYVIEMTPVADGRGAIDRGVVAEGTVGVSWAGRLRLFRYEIRRWRGGTIPDLADAEASPVRVSPGPLVAERPAAGSAVGEQAVLQSSGGHMRGDHEVGIEGSPLRSVE